MLSPIHHTFAPLADRKHVWQACCLLLQPWKWRHGSAVEKLRTALNEKFQAETALFASGREALLVLLKALRYQQGEEVIVQGYTCVVVPNAIKAAGMTPVFVDVHPDTLNLDLEETEQAITSKTRAIICQHTFGIPALTRELRALCDRRGLLLIEDCAHILPDSRGPSEIGTYGDALLLSFGRDKAISGVTGGAVVCRHKEVSAQLRKLEQGAQSLSLLRCKLLLCYPLLYGIARPLYGLWLGKALLALAGKLHLLVPILLRQEKEGVMSLPLHSLPNACATLVLEQLKRLQELNDHRRMLTKLYFDEATKRGWALLLGVKPDLPLQKFPLFVKHAEKFRRALKAKNIHLHDGWTGCAICPPTVDAATLGYRDGQDPSAEMAGQQILSLPTHPTMKRKQALRLIALLDQHMQRHGEPVEP